VGPFEVGEVVGTNAYKLKLPDHWRIWPVISSVYLDKAPDGPDPFKCQESAVPIVSEDDIDHDHWEVAAVVSKKKEHRKIKYLIRWKGFGPEDDWWMDEKDLSGCLELVKEYEKSVGNDEWKLPDSWPE